MLQFAPSSIAYKIGLIICVSQIQKYKYEKRINASPLSNAHSTFILSLWKFIFLRKQGSIT